MEEDTSPLAALVTYSLNRVGISTAISPFSIARRLLQIQFVPLAARQASEEQRARAEKEALERTATAASGYVVEEPHAPLTVLNGYFHAMSATMAAPSEGFTSLWKGNVTSIAVDISRFFIQPTVESLLNEAYGLNDDMPLHYLDNYMPNVGTLLASHALTSVLLAPSELVLTRLAVQPRQECSRAYSGYLHCLRTVVAEEGYSGLFRGAPTQFVLHLFRPLYRSCVPILLERSFGLSEGFLSFDVARSLFHLLELLITLPLETISTRLQVQYQLKYLQTGKRYRTLVATSPLPYAGAVDCARRIIDEEGVGSLYRGIWMHLAVGLLEFATSVFTVVEVDEDAYEDLSDA